MNIPYELTKIDPVKPIDYGNRKMALCPKCNKAQEIVPGSTHQCTVCGMLWQVAK